MVLFACSTAQEKAFFPEKAMKDTLLTFDGVEKTVEEVLSQFKGKVVVLDIWASWCGDCIEGLPKVKELQQTYGQRHRLRIFLFGQNTRLLGKKASHDSVLKGRIILFLLEGKVTFVVPFLWIGFLVTWSWTKKVKFCCTKPSKQQMCVWKPS
jgi:hypothetical protein